ncbi:MAG TPA: histidine kinase dimerization/phospho-acceptor domain-containing protein [Ignavibacteria bacterium]|nr:histidine kinase dimerization/phospho-acceptor domain-containing protein [Ignavibacteria bacterium]
MKLKNKILSGNYIIGFFFVVVSISAIYIINHLVSSSDNILKDNFKSVIAIQKMIDAIDVMDNAIAIQNSNNDSLKSIAIKEFEDAKQKFDENFFIQKNNITEPGEGDLVNNVNINYSKYLSDYSNLKSNLTYDKYISKLHPVYRNIKADCYKLLELNENAIANKNEKYKDFSASAEIFIEVIIIVSIILLILFLYQVPSIIINPLKQLNTKVKAITNKKYSERIEVKSNDEIGELSKSFNEMASKLEEFEKLSMEVLISEKKRTDHIVKSINDGIIVLDEKDNVILINYIASELLNIKEKDILGKNFNELGKYNNLVKNIVDKIENSGGKYLRIVYRDKEEYFIKEITDIKDEATNRSLGKIISLKNVTGFKEIDEAKSGFIATISHELRTPLSAMRMSLRLLDDKRIGELNIEQSKLIHMMQNEVKRLLKLVTELLNLARIESGNEIFKYQEIGAEDLVEAAITPVLLQSEQKNISLDINIAKDLPNLLIDANKIAWVLINFLNNAIRYSPDGSKIYIKVRKDNIFLEFSVKDNGPGIDKENVDKIFDKYFQVNLKNLEINQTVVTVLDLQSQKSLLMLTAAIYG